MGENTIDEKIKFQKLTPINTVQLGAYRDAFDYIFKNNDIRNIAISGPYSAGKSSVLESYKKIAWNKRFLHISLANFSADNCVENKDTCNKEAESVLEVKILNQLIQQIEPKNIPQTKFHVKREISNKNCIFLTVMGILFFLCTLGIVYFKNWKDWIETLKESWIQNVLEYTVFTYSRLLYGIIALIILAIVVFKIIKIQKGKSVFRKLSFQGNEIEIFAEENESYFDKYLNEVIYLFVHSGADVVVFEDIDRFDTSKIFERLREINNLANIRMRRLALSGKGDSYKYRKGLRFFYLIRDDIFINKDRTKFFDFIMPIIPVVDSSNAYNQMKKQLEDGGVFDLFNDRFLRGVSLYIDDLRMVKNIYNEFMIYNNKLNKIDLDPNKMLAIIVYKNIFPRDFADLQLNKGFVYNLFKNKDLIIKDEQDNIEIQCKEIKERIERCKNEHLKNVEEVDKVMNPQISETSRYDEKKRKELEQEKNIRKQAIEDRKNGHIKDLEQELLKLKKQKIDLQNKQLSKIITRENVDNIFKLSIKDELDNIINFENVKSNEYFSLLKFLLREGYLDETYNDYMSHFYENSLTRNDKMFLRSVTDKKAKVYTYALDDVRLVLANLSNADFMQEETKNFDLFDEILNNYLYKEFLIEFIEQLKSDNDLNFIKQFLDTGRSRTRLVEEMCTKWTEFLYTILNSTDFGSARTKIIIIYAVTYLSEDVLSHANIEKCVGNYISNQSDFLSLFSVISDNIIKNFVSIGVLLKKIDYETSDLKLIEGVYINNLYELNMDNVYVFIKERYEIIVSDMVKSRILTVLLENREQALSRYVQERIAEFFKMYLLEDIDAYRDNESTIIKLLNNMEIKFDDKKTYISKLETQIGRITEIEMSELRREIIKEQVVKYDAYNIFSYYVEMGLSEELVEFIESDRCVVDYQVNEYSRDKMEKFGHEILHCKTISEEKYEQILTNINYKIGTFNSKDIEEGKMLVLIRNGILPMKEQILSFVREYYSNVLMVYIEQNLEEYVKIAKGVRASKKEILEILDWEVPVEYKIELLKEIKEPVSIKNKIYEEEIFIWIIKHNLLFEELDYLFSEYSNLKENTKKEIINVAKEHINSLKAKINFVSLGLVIDMLGENSISKAVRVSIFQNSANRFNKEQCRIGLKNMGYNHLGNLMVNNTRPRIEISEENKLLLDVLKSNRFISNYVCDEENRCYRIRRSKKRKKAS